MDDFVNNSAAELRSACFDHLISTSAARLSEEIDHVYYMIQPSLCTVSRAFFLRLSPRFRHAKFVRVHFAASEELSPERFIPVVSTSAIHLNYLSRTEKERVFLADISVCDQTRDGRTASQDTRSSNVVVSLDALSFWLAIIASKQYAVRGSGSLSLTIFGHIWSEADGPGSDRGNLFHALSLLDQKNTQLEIWAQSKRLAEDHHIWCLQRPETPLEAVLLRKSWLERALRHGRVLKALKNTSALQVMCADVMRHVMSLRDSVSSQELRRHLAQILCSLLLTWASHYHHQRHRQLRDIFTEETEEQEDIKEEEAKCAYASCPCVLFHILGLPEADTLTPSLRVLKTYGIDEPAWLELCLVSLTIHYIRYHPDHSDPSSARRTCLASLQRLASMGERKETGSRLATDTQVLSVVINEGLRALKDRPDLRLAVPIDEEEDPDLVDSFEVFNRLSLCADAEKASIWEIHQEGIRRITLDHIDNGDIFESHLLNLDVLRSVRERSLAVSMREASE